MLVERLGDDEVGDALHGGRRRGGPARPRRPPASAHGRPAADSAASSPRSVRIGRVDAPREVAQLGDGRLGAVVGLRDQRPAPRRDRSSSFACARPRSIATRQQPLLRAVVQVALDPAPLGLGRVDPRALLARSRSVRARSLGVSLGPSRAVRATRGLPDAPQDVDRHVARPHRAAPGTRRAGGRSSLVAAGREVQVSGARATGVTAARMRPQRGHHTLNVSTNSTAPIGNNISR